MYFDRVKYFEHIFYEMKFIIWHPITAINMEPLTEPSKQIIRLMHYETGILHTRNMLYFFGAHSEEQKKWPRRGDVTYLNYPGFSPNPKHNYIQLWKNADIMSKHLMHLTESRHATPDWNDIIFTKTQPYLLIDIENFLKYLLAQEEYKEYHENIKQWLVFLNGRLHASEEQRWELASYFSSTTASIMPEFPYIITDKVEHLDEIEIPTVELLDVSSD